LVELLECARSNELVEQALVLSCRAVNQVNALGAAQRLGSLDKCEDLIMMM
jgi:hypothetical protein